MKALIIFSLVTAWQCLGGPVPASIPPHSNPARQAPAGFQHSFDLKNEFLQRDVLLSADGGFTVTCVDCAMEGAFDMVGTFDFDTSLAEKFGAQLASKAAPAASKVTAGVASLTSAAVPFVTSLAGSVGTGLKDGLKNIFGRDVEIKRDTNADNLQKLMNGIKLQLIQKRPIKSKFDLEVVTGDQAISFAIPSSAPITFGLQGKALDGPQAIIIPFAPTFELSVLFKPVLVRMSASIAPNVNTTVPFGGDLSLTSPFELGLAAIKGETPDLKLHSGTLRLNSIDPKLCLSVAIGPLFGLRLKHIPTNTQANFTASLELPRVTFCVDKNENVNAACAAEPGPIFKNSIHVNGTIDVGVTLEAGLEVGGLNVPLPGLDTLGVPSLKKTFSALDKCFSTD